jgi:hypothetical protein
VTDEETSSDPVPAAAAPAESSEPPVPAEPDGTPPALADRRAFIRQLSGDAVASAGRIAGFSSVFRRTVLAAGVAATRELQPAPNDVAPEIDPSAGPVAADQPGTPTTEGATPAPPSSAGGTTARPMVDVLAALTRDQHDLLARVTRAVFAVNDATGAPHLSASPCHWDGEILRLPSQMFAARAAHVDRDPRVTVYIEERSSGAWVTVTGTASLVYGEAATREIAGVIGDDPGSAAATGWNSLLASADAVVIQVRPVRFLWRPG